MSKILNRALKLCGENKIVGASATAITILEYEVDGMITRAKGATVPTDADAGYAVGCTFVDTTGGALATLYVNDGTATDSCAFVAVNVSQA